MTMFNKVSKSFRFGNHDVTLTTGEIARQATGACICQMDDTVVLATVVAKKETKPGQDFFPLTVDYIEKTYAAGKIPGGFFKREGRPSEKETLTSRLIDRPIRPLFPDGFFNEVQVIIHVLSADPAVDPDIPASPSPASRSAARSAPAASATSMTKSSSTRPRKNSRAPASTSSSPVRNAPSSWLNPRPTSFRKRRCSKP